MSLLADSLASPSDVFWTLFWATVGGIAVFIGLSIEKLAELMNDAFQAPPYKPHKALGELGWAVLMIGILIEIIVGGSTALDEWQTRQMVIKNDPLKQPIVSFTAYVRLVVRPFEKVNNFSNLPVCLGPSDLRFRLPDHGNGEQALLTVGNAWQMGYIYGPWLPSENVSESNASRGNERLIRFDLYFSFEQNPNRELRFMGKTANDIIATQIQLPIACGVVNGEIELVINNSKKVFMVPKQRTFMNDDVSSVMTNGTFIPLPKDDIIKMLNPEKFRDWANTNF